MKNKNIPTFTELTLDTLTSRTYIGFSYEDTYESEGYFLLFPIKFPYENLITYEPIEPKIQIFCERIVPPKSLQRQLEEFIFFKFGYQYRYKKSRIESTYNYIDKTIRINVEEVFQNKQEPKNKSIKIIFFNLIKNFRLYFQK
jgi:hypothetical protein